MLSETALEVLRQYWKAYKPEKWLFEGARTDRYISIRTVQKILEHACKKADIKKEITVHTLRWPGLFRQPEAVFKFKQSACRVISKDKDK